MTNHNSAELRRLHENANIDYYPKEIVDQFLADVALRIAPLAEAQSDRPFPTVTQVNAFDILESKIVEKSPQDIAKIIDGESDLAKVIEAIENDQDEDGVLDIVDEVIKELSRVPNQESLTARLMILHEKISNHLSLKN